MAECEAVKSAGPIQARLQVPSSEWLKVNINLALDLILGTYWVLLTLCQVHGLSGQQLSLDQILPGLGFKQKEGRLDMNTLASYPGTVASLGLG